MPVLSKMNGGGNVKVVVRVRAFLQRGLSFNSHPAACASNESLIG